MFNLPRDSVSLALFSRHRAGPVPPMEFGRGPFDAAVITNLRARVKAFAKRCFRLTLLALIVALVRAKNSRRSFSLKRELAIAIGTGRHIRNSTSAGD